MTTVWVYQEDGTLQCGLGKEIPLEVMQETLEMLVGAPRRTEKRTTCNYVNFGCGKPTGQVNAYEITTEQAYTLFHGFVGPNGFRLWTCDGTSMDDIHPSFLTEKNSDGTEVSFPFAHALGGADTKLSMAAGAKIWGNATDASQQPVLIRELVGRLCRVYHPGDALTLDLSVCPRTS